MRTLLPKTFTFLFSFILGLAVVSILYPPTLFTDRSTEEIPQVPFTEFKSSPPEAMFEFGCNDQASVDFWKKLDKEQFLRQKKAEFRLYDMEFHGDYFDTEWESLRQKFNCSFFTSPTAVDLNNDGILEISVLEAGGMRSFSLYIFRQTEKGLDLILVDADNIEDHPQATFHNGFPDMQTMSNYTGDGRMIKNYRFNGKVYVPTKCFDESRHVDIKGEWIPIDHPIFTRVSCDSRNWIVR